VVVDDAAGLHGRVGGHRAPRLLPLDDVALEAEDLPCSPEFVVELYHLAVVLQGIDGPLDVGGIEEAGGPLVGTHAEHPQGERAVALGETLGTEEFADELGVCRRVVGGGAATGAQGLDVRWGEAVPRGDLAP
jgi:hypothetical protein